MAMTLKIKGVFMNHTCKEGGWNCPLCHLNFRTRRLFYKHKKEEHSESRLDIKENRTCKYCGFTSYTTSAGMLYHEKCCLKNPNKLKLNYDWCKTEAFRRKASEIMKERHKNGTAKSFQNRNKFSHSYPELWFIKFLENEYSLKENIDYKTEFKFGKYFLDFAWENQKKCIEIDGDQHIYDENRIKSDELKDKLLKENNWSVLRIRWKWICEQHYIHINDLKDLINKFINNS